MMIAFHVLCVICSMTWACLYCYFATFATNRLTALSQVAYDANWLNWPPELQKYITLITARSQMPIHFTGLGLFRCTLEVLGQVSILQWKTFTVLQSKYPDYFFFFSFSSLGHLARTTWFLDTLHNANTFNDLKIRFHRGNTSYLSMYCTLTWFLHPQSAFSDRIYSSCWVGEMQPCEE